MSAPGRYAPARSFPPYAFVPGKHPHPTRDPAGHAYGHASPPPRYLEASSWRVNEDYLFGVDLYNHGFLWEAHEAWEGLWHPAKHDREQADLLQGLIQCAAACLKVDMGQPRGLEILARLGIEKLERTAREEGGTYMGLDVLAFVAAMRDFAASAPDSSAERPRIVLEGH